MKRWLYAMRNVHYNIINIYKLSVSVIIVLYMFLYNAPFSRSIIVNSWLFFV